jgi:hypothetical protein
MMSAEGERREVEVVIAYFKVLFQNCVKNTMEDLCQDSWHPDDAPSG